MRKLYLLIVLLLVCSIEILAANKPNVTAITEVFGDGQKLTGVILEYPMAINGKKLTKETFEVTDRTILNIYTNDVSEKAKNSKNGKYVIIELDPKDKNSGILYLKCVFNKCFIFISLFWHLAPPYKPLPNSPQIA